MIRCLLFIAAVACMSCASSPPPRTGPIEASLGPFYCCPPSGLICRPGQRDYAGDVLGSSQFAINAHCSGNPGHCHCP